MSEISFFDRHDPALPVGTYELTAEQRITSPPDKDDKPPPKRIIDEHPTSTTRFAVSGPRFAIAPTAIAGQFPPPDTDGDYGAVLAHVAFERLTLPWDRSADVITPDGTPSRPWLAVLVFDESEHVVATDVLVGDLHGATLPAGTKSYADADPGWAPEPGQSLEDKCRVIDLDVDLFTKVAPAKDDLMWLAHTRSQSGGSSQSYVTANRMPAPGTASTAHLVSLEHLAEFLPTDGKPAAALAGAKAVRLVSLASWTFKTLTQTFADRLGAVPFGVFSLPDPGSSGAGGGDTVERAITLGYCALRHRTRAGDSTISWYRGPLVPCEVTDGIVPAADPDAAEPVDPISTADALLRYDPQTAMFDISYAAAWQLGRLLAMADDHFSSRLRAWKATVTERTALALERELIGERLGSVLALDAHPATALKAAAAILPSRVGAALDSASPSTEAPDSEPDATGLHERLARAIGDPQSLPDAALPPSLHDWLAALAQLEGVPLRYLVPDERLLPSPSLRFFRLDPNWTRALVEGAFSIARSSTSQAAHDAAVAPTVHAAAAPPASGLLLRSSIVDDWPDLVYTARNAAGEVLHTTVQRIAPGIVLALFDDLAATVEIHEAPTTLHLDLSSINQVPASGDRVVDVAGLAGLVKAANSAVLARRLAADGEGIGYRIEAV